MIFKCRLVKSLFPFSRHLTTTQTGVLRCRRSVRLPPVGLYASLRQGCSGVAHGVSISDIVGYIHMEINGCVSNVEARVFDIARVLDDLADRDSNTNASSNRTVTLDEAIMIIEDIGASAEGLLEYISGKSLEGARMQSVQEEANCVGHIPDLKATLEKLGRSGKTNRLCVELTRHGFRIKGEGRRDIISYSGQRHPLTLKQWDFTSDFPRLWKFVQKEYWPGMYCERCGHWFRQEEITDAQREGSEGYAPDSGCLGCCNAAKRWSAKQTRE